MRDLGHGALSHDHIRRDLVAWPGLQSLHPFGRRLLVHYFDPYMVLNSVRTCVAKACGLVTGGLAIYLKRPPISTVLSWLVLFLSDRIARFGLDYTIH